MVEVVGYQASGVIRYAVIYAIFHLLIFSRLKLFMLRRSYGSFTVSLAVHQPTSYASFPPFFPCNLPLASYPSHLLTSSPPHLHLLLLLPLSHSQPLIYSQTPTLHPHLFVIVNDNNSVTGLSSLDSIFEKVCKRRIVVYDASGFIGFFVSCLIFVLNPCADFIGGRWQGIIAMK